MSRYDWYRQTTWSETQAANFFQRLAKSRSAFHRAQYLRIQAVTLAETGQRAYLKAALDLLERIFTEYPEEFDVPLAYLQAALCHDALDNVEAARSHFESALAEQSKRPNVDTGVAHEFPWFIVRRGIVELYDRAIEVLASAQSAFPVQHFKESACRALIAAHQGDVSAAKASARRALDAANQRRSSFAGHPDVGLVGEGYVELIARLETLVSA